MSGRDVLPVEPGDPTARPVTGAHDVRRQRTEFEPVGPVRPPRGAPNVVVVLVDDMGFGASSPYGGPCVLPTAQRLADGGLRYSRFHVTALCSPTRQSLMTGRNHHAVGMGATTEMATSAPGYTGFRPRSAATMAQILSGNGYRTGAFGKWHQTPPREVSAAGPFERWPTGEGFDRFYGFMAAEMNHWYPQLYDGTTPVEPDRSPEDGYHLSEDLVDNAIDWVRAGRALDPDAPFFTYLAFGATHAPFHVAPSWCEPYRGAFDAGWDAQREQTLARQRELGIVPDGTELAPWARGVPHWDELSADDRVVAARFMETYAGFAAHTDAQVGRFVDELDALGVLDDTLLVYLLGDNGASGEGGISGTLREHLVGHGIPDDTADMVGRLDEFGGPTTYGIYPVGWALAMNTPYQWTKQVASHFGGTRDGAIVHWPRGITDGGAIRHQFHHVIDILPTVLDAAGIPAPHTVYGAHQQPLDGISMRYTFADPGAADRRTTQYFEMCGNRGIYHHGWTAVTRHGIPWRMVPGDLDFDADVWELYDTAADPSQAHDRAGEHPEKLRELQQLFLIEAARNTVFPLDDRVTERENPKLAGRLDLFGDRRSVTFHPNTGRLTEETAPNTKNRSHTVTATVDVPDGGAHGVLVAQGGRFGGWSLYCHLGALCYAYNRYGTDRYVVRAPAPVPPGRRELRLEFAYDGGGTGRGATATLAVDGAAVATGRIGATTAYYFSFDETLNVGVDRGTPVTEDYPPRDNGFTGTVRTVRIDLAEPDPASGYTPEDLRRRALAHQ